MNKRLMALLVFFHTILLGMVGLSLNVATEPFVPAVYIFGDSIFDVGTNNFLPDSTARANKSFYGIDFPNSEATGRFSNGYNTADSIVQLLGFEKSPPPYLYLLQNGTEDFRSEILKGVNFASGGSGLLYQTGKHRYHRVVSMADQIQQFSTVHSNISDYLNGTADAIINKSLFLVCVGSNDIFEFFFNNFNPNETMVQELLSTLMSTYQTHLKNLLDLGARKFGILSVPPLGCVPLLQPANGTGQCIEGLNAFAQEFHTALGGLLQTNLSSEFPDMKYSLGDSYEVTMAIRNKPAASTLKNVKTACCGNLTVNGGVGCGPDAQVCEERGQFLFWDEVHPTQIASQLAALAFYTGGSEVVAPMNLGHLVSPQ